MADINVERKGPSIWPWIIGLVVLALLIWALVEMFGDRTDTVGTGITRDTVIVDTPRATTPPPPAAAPVTPVDTQPVAGPGAAPRTDTLPGAPGVTPP